MKFWIFMLMMDLLIPVIMIGFGSYFAKNAPKEINSIFGYRTPRSMKNKDTWEFAHHHCGKRWRTIGRIMLIGSALAMICVFGKDIDCIGAFGAILCVVQTLILIASIFPTEAALKRTFDENGCRRV